MDFEMVCFLCAAAAAEADLCVCLCERVGELYNYFNQVIV